jgi:hypothetical protein
MHPRAHPPAHPYAQGVRTAMRTEHLSTSGETSDSQGEDDGFEVFWAAYPPGDDPHPKRPAREAWDRAISAGADPEVIIRAAKRFAEGQRAKGKTGTPWVPFPARWLDDQRWDDQRWRDEGDTAPPELKVREGEDPQWTNIKRRLCEAVGGPVLVNSWLGEVAFAIADDVVWLSARSGYMRDAILERFDHHLLPACQAVMPSVRSVEVTVALARASGQ